MPQNNFLAYAKKKARAASTGIKKFGKAAGKEMNKMKKKMTTKKAPMRKRAASKRATRKPASKKMSNMGSTRKTYTASELKKAGLKQMTHKGKKYYVKKAKQTATNRTGYTREADKRREALPAGRRYVYSPELRRYVSYTETRVDRSDRARGRV